MYMHGIPWTCTKAHTITPIFVSNICAKTVHRLSVEVTDSWTSLITVPVVPDAVLCR